MFQARSNGQPKKKKWIFKSGCNLVLIYNNLDPGDILTILVPELLTLEASSKRDVCIIGDSVCSSHCKFEHETWSQFVEKMGKMSHGGYIFYSIQRLYVVGQIPAGSEPTALHSIDSFSTNRAVVAVLACHQSSWFHCQSQRWFFFKSYRLVGSSAKMFETSKLRTCDSYTVCGTNCY